MVVGQDHLARTRLFLDARGNRTHACGQDRGEHASVAGFDKLHGRYRLTGQRWDQTPTAPVKSATAFGRPHPLDIARAGAVCGRSCQRKFSGPVDLTQTDIGLGHQHLSHGDSHLLGRQLSPACSRASTRRRTRPGRTHPQWPRPAIAPASSRTGPFDRQRPISIGSVSRLYVREESSMGG